MVWIGEELEAHPVPWAGNFSLSQVIQLIPFLPLHFSTALFALPPPQATLVGEILAA